MIAFAAPHLCSGCGYEGDPLCANCKYDIISEPFLHCVACGSGLPGKSGMCSACDLPYSRAWCVADRRDALQRLIGSFKLSNMRAAYRPLAGLLHDYLPVLPGNTVIVPVPTVNSHIRQRGYDHMRLIANEFARLRKLPVEPYLRRTTSTTQHGANRAQRLKQAKAAFSCDEPLDKNKIYLVVDDVITTGATVKYAAKILKDAGARDVWVVSISRQPLD